MKAIIYPKFPRRYLARVAHADGTHHAQDLGLVRDLQHLGQLLHAIECEYGKGRLFPPAIRIHKA